MNIAILSDIHGNAFALREVLNVAKQFVVKKIFVLGDLVGYYYEPDVVLDLFSDWDTVFIRGNHEEIMSEILNGELSFEYAKKRYGSGHRIAIDKLSDEQIKQLISLPVHRRIKIGNSSFDLYHGSPIEKYMYLYPDSDPELLNNCDSDADFVLVGHSHYEFIHRNKNSLLINVGSVGQSKSKGGVACWSMINTISKTVKIMHTPYPVEELLKQVERIDPDVAYLKTILKK